VAPAPEPALCQESCGFRPLSGTKPDWGRPGLGTNRGFLGEAACFMTVCHDCAESHPGTTKFCSWLAEVVSMLFVGPRQAHLPFP